MNVAYSVNGVPVRLTEERWEHITGNKPYMEAYHEKVLEAISKPACVLRGYAGSVIAVLPLARQKYLHVVYKEVR